MTCTMRPRQTLASARRGGGPPRGVCPAGGGGAGGGLGDGATSRAGRRRAFEGSLPRAAGGLGPRSPAGRSRAVCGSRAPPDFRSVCSPIVPEADGAAVRERSRPARRTTARGGVHARRGTDVVPMAGHASRVGSRVHSHLRKGPGCWARSTAGVPTF